MVFPKLAVGNFRRNPNRYILGVTGMILAAIVICATLSTAPGFNDLAQMPVRRILGADIVVLGTNYFSGIRELSQSDIDRNWQYLSPDQPTSIGLWLPNLVSKGYAAPQDPTANLDMKTLQSWAESRADVVTVVPYLSLPVLVGDETLSNGASLVARGKAASDAYGYSFDDMVVGPYGLKRFEGGFYRFVAFANLHAPYPVPERRQKITVRVPRIQSIGASGPIFDYSELETFQFFVVDHYTFSLGQSYLWEPDGTPVVHGDGRPVAVEAPWEGGEIFIPEETWHAIYRQVSPSTNPAGPFVGQASLILKTMRDARTAVSDLQRQFPNWKAITVPDLLKWGPKPAAVIRHSDGDREVVYRPARVAAIPANISLAVAGMALLISGMLIAINMTILVNQRLREIGILRALGASSGEVFSLVLTETLGIALIGALLGWLPVGLFFGAIQAVSTGARLQAIVVDALRTGAITMAVAVVVALIFGLIPAYQAVRLTTADILRKSQ